MKNGASRTREATMEEGGGSRRNQKVAVQTQAKNKVQGGVAKGRSHGGVLGGGARRTSSCNRDGGGDQGEAE